MGKVDLSSIFREDYFRTVSSHIKRIQSVLDEYDLVIFMARKAICFYEALKNNGEVKNSNCKVVSSRVVYYNTLSKYKNKKIAVIDDVVVRGRSINRVAATLKREDLKADYFVAACEKNFLSDFENKNSVKITTHITYPRSDIYHFSGLITQYIEASMRTFNVDSPVYEITNEIDDIEYKLKNIGAVTLTSGLQTKSGIKSRSLYFSYNSESTEESNIISVLKESIIKIRFYNNENKIIAVPFVLLPECNINVLEELYQIIKTPEIDEFITYGNERRIRENKYKLVSYFLSDALFRKFALDLDLNYSRDAINDIIQFDKNLDDIMNGRIRKYLIELMNNVRLSSFSFSRLLMSEYVKNAYSFIMKRNPNEQEYEDAYGNIFGSDVDYQDGKLGQIAFSFSDIFDWIKEKNQEQSECFPYVSSIIDIFVDTGFIVPAILHKKNEITLRAYKMGEYSKLSKEQINAFTKMIYSYQTTVDRYLDKIEFEKLCVLFYREMSRKAIFAEKTTFDDGDYCIAYSFYGPRISSSKELYTVRNETAFITDLDDENILKEYKKKYYIDHEKPVDNEELSKICYEFASVYADLSDVFTKHPYVKRKKNEEDNPNDEHWNMYVHTLDQFLTLLAIGKNIREQILSLCAEVKMVTQIDEDMFLLDVEKLPLKKYKTLLSGINSGLWKYKCFKGDAINKTLDRVKYYNPYLSKDLLYSLAGPSNKHDSIGFFLDDCGMFLFKAAYVINELLKHTNRISDFNFDEIEDKDYSSSHENKGENENTKKNVKEMDNQIIFDVPNYYYRRFEKDRERISGDIEELYKNNEHARVIKRCLEVLHRDAKILLDKCDMYLTEESINEELVEDFLIIHSDSASLSDRFKNVTHLPLEEVSKLHVTEVFPILHPEDLDDVLERVIYQTDDVNDCEYLLVHQKGTKFGFSYTENMAKGTSIKQELNEIIKDIGKKPRCGKYLYVYQKDDESYSAFGRVTVKQHQFKERRKHGFLYSYAISPLIKEEGNVGPIINAGKIDKIVLGNNNAVGDNSSVGLTNIEEGAQVACLTSGVENYSEVNDSSISFVFDSEKVNKQINEIREELAKEKLLRDEVKEELRSKLIELEKEIKKPKPNASIIDGVLKGIGFLRDYAELGVAIAALIKLFTHA